MGCGELGLVLVLVLVRILRMGMGMGRWLCRCPKLMSWQRRKKKLSYTTSRWPSPRCPSPR